MYMYLQSTRTSNMFVSCKHFQGGKDTSISLLHNERLRFSWVPGCSKNLEGKTYSAVNLLMETDGVNFVSADDCIHKYDCSFNP